MPRHRKVISRDSTRKKLQILRGFTERLNCGRYHMLSAPKRPL